MGGCLVWLQHLQRCGAADLSQPWKLQDLMAPDFLRAGEKMPRGRVGCDLGGLGVHFLSGHIETAASAEAIRLEPPS
jgi:hypothetical protein